MSSSVAFLKGFSLALGALVVVPCLFSCETDPCEDLSEVEPYELPIGEFGVVNSENIDLGSSASLLLTESELSVEYSVVDTETRIKLQYVFRPLVERE